MLRATADAAADAVRLTQFGTRPLLALVAALAGAGKTTVIIHITHDVLELGESVAITTNTNEQGFDLAVRLAGSLAGNPPAHLLVRDGLRLPPAVEAAQTAGHLIIVHTPGDLPRRGPFVAIANAAKWSWTENDLRPVADLVVCDEFFQMGDATAERVLSIGDRILGVGDPGQIDPVVTIGVEEWAHLLDGPHRPAPDAIRHRVHGPGVVELTLPYTRRLPSDTIPFISGFYPQLGAGSVVDDNDRGLRLASRARRRDSIDDIVEAMAAGESVTMASLPSKVTGERDPAVAAGVAAIATRLMDRRASFTLDGTAWVPLEPRHMMAVAPHNSQAAALQRSLPPGTVIGTTNKLQGLQAPVVLGWHPLSGLDTVDDFHADAGRACVTISRHQVAHCLVGRDGVDELLDVSLPETPLVPDVPGDRGYDGWAAHRNLETQLRTAGRVRPL